MLVSTDFHCTPLSVVTLFSLKVAWSGKSLIVHFSMMHVLSTDVQMFKIQEERGMCLGQMFA